jgi:hypothetical protein
MRYFFLLFLILYDEKLDFLLWSLIHGLILSLFFWQADAAFAAKEYIIAASFYTKVTPILLFVSLLNLLLFMLSYLHWG